MIKRNKIRTLVAFVILISFVVVSTGFAHNGPNFSKKPSHQGQYFVDKNKDGICDNYGMRIGLKSQVKKGKGYGPGDGTGNFGKRPLDGTGYGAKYNACWLVR
jgi:hypothetical protein